MFGKKTQQIKSLKESIRYWEDLAKVYRDENSILKQKVFTDVWLKKQNNKLTEELFQVKVERDTLAQVLKQLQINIKLK